MTVGTLLHELVGADSTRSARFALFLPEYNCIPHHDVVLRRSSTDAGWRILLEPGGPPHNTQSYSVFQCVNHMN